ncbi:MAG: glycerol-3-phosphate 1-O-acyltransferase PlsY [Gammaproteobacteria bacterium]|nr:glycerol-3-phosphate 1-O-acyltransferase PlsY [Gammaproteobacteria bacterium]
MPESLSAVLMVLIGYLMGSVSCAVIVSRAFKLPDPRQGGSGNPGATNVLRLGGRKAALLTLLGDILKGVLPVLFARALGLSAGLVALTGLAAFAGHLYPIFFRFMGGKGVATAGGVITTISPLTGALAGLVWLGMALLFRYSSLASLTAGIVAPFIAWWAGAQAYTVLALLVISVLLVWRHRGNIERLRKGTESRIGQKG